MFQEKESLVLGKFQMLTTIGEGGYGKVRLAINQETSEQVAIKIVSKEKLDSPDAIKKETSIMRLLSHSNVVKLLQVEETETCFFIVLEFARGGELFDHIEPDSGVDEEWAHMFFHQLVLGVEHIHSRGICHRDLKPENLLLDGSGNLKISDFGLATLWRVNGKIRPLMTKCGTPPYVAPEVLRGKYDGRAVDVWSMGVILVTLLGGYIPWDEPTAKCWEFVKVAKRDFDFYPFNKFNDVVLDLLKNILQVDFRQRYTIDKIKAHPWFTRENQVLRGRKRQRERDALLAEEAVSKMSCLETADSQQPFGENTNNGNSSDADKATLAPLDFKKQSAGVPLSAFTSLSLPPFESRQTSLSSTQPSTSAFTSLSLFESSSQPALENTQFSTNLITTSQPTPSSMDFEASQCSMLDDLLAMSQSQWGSSQTQTQTQGMNLKEFKFKKLVNRMTRFSTHVPAETILHSLLAFFKKENMAVQHEEASFKMKVETTNPSGRSLAFKVNIMVVPQQMQELQMVEFRRISGDMLQFKRLYNRAKKAVCA
eukprot:GCRY01001284.1.p1 GENE.GCRY01001284.1~~GCRY01001284.1.p1  ORF type:complete len:540 (-),score=116.60 GCRY01001284.1:48-1667(-)